MATHTAFNSQGRKISRVSGLARRQQIIHATLRLIIREGLRGVRHRAVAQEANVPLAATTYSFKSLDELLSEAFSCWAETNAHRSILFREKCLSALEEYSNAGELTRERRAALAEALSTITANYVIKQVTEYFDDRVLEAALYHEVQNNGQLRDLVLALRQGFLNDLVTLVDMAGSSQPRLDAQITLSLIQQLEQSSVMRGSGATDSHEIRQIIHRHVFQMLRL